MTESLPVIHRSRSTGKLRIVGYTIVDADTAEAIGEWPLYDRAGYVWFCGQPLHRHVMGLTKGDGLVCHHKNEYAYDNRRANLEVMTPMEHTRSIHPIAMWRESARARASKEYFRALYAGANESEEA